MDQAARERRLMAVVTAQEGIREAMASLETAHQLAEGNYAMVLSATGENPPHSSPRYRALRAAGVMRSETERALATGVEAINALTRMVEGL